MKSNHPKTDPVTDRIIALSKTIISQSKSSYIKIGRFKLYADFLKKYPIQYQRDDKITLDYRTFCERTANSGICSSWKLHRKRTKTFKLSRRKVNLIASINTVDIFSE